jgi:hypothetical protein
MIRKLSILSLAVLPLAVAPRVQADTLVLKADVPFAFVVADRQLPSGEYQFVRSDNPSAIKIYSRQHGHLLAVLGQPLPAASGEGAVLVFHRHGGQLFLKSIRSGNGSGLYFPNTRAENRLEAAATTAGGM